LNISFIEIAMIERKIVTGKIAIVTESIVEIETEIVTVTEVIGIEKETEIETETEGEIDKEKKVVHKIDPQNGDPEKSEIAVRILMFVHRTVWSSPQLELIHQLMVFPMHISVSQPILWIC
jgi:hypothetical protein